VEIDSSQDAFSRVRAALIEAARERRLVTYKDVAEIMEYFGSGVEMGRRVGALGDAINEYEHQAGRPMLSALIAKARSRMPREGFYHGAFALGRTTPFGDKLGKQVFWESERDAVYDEWAR